MVAPLRGGSDEIDPTQAVARCVGGGLVVKQGNAVVTGTAVSSPRPTTLFAAWRRAGLATLGRRAVWAVWSALALPLVVLVSCQNPNRMFTGVWQAEGPIGDESWSLGRPELSIGHFGTELTGLVRFLDDSGLPTRPCACAFIEHQRLDLDTANFVALTEQCDGSLWVWNLTLTGDSDENSYLTGTVTEADGTGFVEFSARLIDRFVPDDRRECQPEPQ